MGKIREGQSRGSPETEGDSRAAQLLQAGRRPAAFSQCFPLKRRKGFTVKKNRKDSGEWVQ